MQTILLILALLLYIPTAGLCAPIVRAYVFMSPECSSCEPAKEHSIKAVARKAGCQVDLKYFNIDNLPDYKKLVELEKKLGDTGNEMPVIICGSKVLGGEKEIKAGLESTFQRYANSGTDWPDSSTSEPLKVSGKQPRVLLSSNVVNAGRMLPGSEKWVSITLSNIGSAPLKVTGLRSACPCYKPIVSRKTLLPGEQTHIRIHIKAIGMSGKIDKFVMVDTNDSATPTSRIKVSVDIPAVIKATPSRISFGGIKVGKTIERQISVTSIGSRLKAQSTSPSIKVLSTTKKGSTYIVKVRIEGKSPGRLLGRINLISKKPDCKIDVLVFGNVIP